MSKSCSEDRKAGAVSGRKSKSCSSMADGNVFQLLAWREVSSKGGNVFKHLRKEAQRVNVVGRKYKITNPKQSLMSWVEAESLNHLSSKYCPLLLAPRSTIATAFSRGGKTLASTHGDHTVKIIDCATGCCVKVLSGHLRTPWVVRFHPLHPEILASGSLDNEVRLWNANTATCFKTKDFNRPIASIAFHAQGEILAVASGRKLYIWNYDDHEKGSFPSIILKTRRSLKAVHFHPHGAPFLLTAEVNDLDSPDTPLTPAITSGYLRYAPPSIFFAKVTSTFHPSVEAVPSSALLLDQRLRLELDSWNVVSQNLQSADFPLSHQRQTHLFLSTEDVPDRRPNTSRNDCVELHSYPETSGHANSLQNSFNVSGMSSTPPLSQRNEGILQAPSRHATIEHGDISRDHLDSSTITESQRISRNVNTRHHMGNTGSSDARGHPRAPTSVSGHYHLHRTLVASRSLEGTHHLNGHDAGSRTESASLNMFADVVPSDSSTDLPCTVKLRIWPHDLQKPSEPLETSSCLFTIHHVALCSEMGAHFSPCGRFLAACVACVLPQPEVGSGSQSRSYRDSAEVGTSPTGHSISGRKVIYELRVYSLEAATFGSVLVSRAIRAAHCLTSIQFSPTSKHILLAYGRRHKSLLRSIIADGDVRVHIYTILEVYRASDLELVGVLSSDEDEVNVACFHPMAGEGLVYGTKGGKLRLLQGDDRNGINITGANVLLGDNIEIHAFEC